MDDDLRILLRQMRDSLKNIEVMMKENRSVQREAKEKSQAAEWILMESLNLLPPGIKSRLEPLYQKKG